MTDTEATTTEPAQEPPTIEDLLAELVTEVRELRRTVAAAGVVVGHEVAGGGSVTQSLQQLNIARRPDAADHPPAADSEN